MQTLTENEIQDKLVELTDWSVINDAIQRTYQFKDFVQAMEFVNTVAEMAEADQHHPDILVRYNKVTLTLSTHDANGVTEKDFKLATQADNALKG